VRVVAGTATDDGPDWRPPHGAAGRDAAAGVTSAGGRFALDGIPIGTRLAIRAETEHPVSSSVAVVTARADGPTDVVLTLAEPVTLTVWARGADGKDIEPCMAVWFDSEHARPIAVGQGMTPMSLIVPAGPGTLRLDAPGFATAIRTIDAPRDGRTMTVTMEAARPLFGTVVDDAGEPIAGTHVSFGVDDPFVQDGLVRIRGADTGPDGAFRDEDAYDGEIVAAVGWNAGPPCLCTVRAKDSPVRIVVPRYASVQARVVVPEGSELPAAFGVFLGDDGPRVQSPPWFGGPRPFGALPGQIVGETFRVARLPAGDYGLRILAGEFLPVRVTVHARPGATESLPDLVFERGCTVEGRVSDADGAAVSGARVECLDDEWAADPTETSAEGRFTLSPLAPGRHLLGATLPGRAARVWLDVTANGQPVTLTVAPTRNVFVRVLDAAGDPVVRRIVHLVLHGERSGIASRGDTDDRGIAEFDVLPGEYVLRVRGAHDGTDVERPVTIGPGTRGDVEVRLP
jgi:hypothetical protein